MVPSFGQHMMATPTVKSLHNSQMNFLKRDGGNSDPPSEREKGRLKKKQSGHNHLEVDGLDGGQCALRLAKRGLRPSQLPLRLLPPLLDAGLCCRPPRAPMRSVTSKRTSKTRRDSRSCRRSTWLVVTGQPGRRRGARPVPLRCGAPPSAGAPPPAGPAPSAAACRSPPAPSAAATAPSPSATASASSPGRGREGHHHFGGSWPTPSANLTQPGGGVPVLLGVRAGHRSLCKHAL